MTDNITDLIGLSRDRATRPDCEDAYLIRELADALEAAVKEMHARELHHFEEEKLRAEAEAERDRYRAALINVKQMLTAFGVDAVTPAIEASTRALDGKEAE